MRAPAAVAVLVAWVAARWKPEGAAVPKTVWMTSESWTPEAAAAVAQWQRLNPEWTVRHMDDAEIRAFVCAEFEPELCALAARQSWQQGGTEVFLSDLQLDDSGYDGAVFAVGYRRQRYLSGS